MINIIHIPLLYLNTRKIFEPMFYRTSFMQMSRSLVD